MKEALNGNHPDYSSQLKTAVKTSQIDASLSTALRCGSTSELTAGSAGRIARSELLSFETDEERQPTHVRRCQSLTEGCAVRRVPLEKQIAFIDVQIRAFQSGPPHLGMNRALVIAALRKRQGYLLAKLAAHRG